MNGYTEYTKALEELRDEVRSVRVEILEALRMIKEVTDEL